MASMAAAGPFEVTRSCSSSWRSSSDVGSAETTAASRRRRGPSATNHFSAYARAHAPVMAAVTMATGIAPARKADILEVAAAVRT